MVSLWSRDWSGSYKMKWIDEKVLQKYFKESFEQYNNWFLKEFDEKLVSVEYNQPFDRFPDLFGVLESGKRIGMEVEWTTKDFNHDHNVISDGLIIVLQNNDPFFQLKQLELSKEKFEKWYVKNSKRIFNESVNTIIKDKSKIKRPPKLWFYYSGTDSFKNREKTLQSKTFGVPFNFRQKERFQDIRKGDLFCFIGPFKNMRGGVLHQGPPGTQDVVAPPPWGMGHDGRGAVERTVAGGDADLREVPLDWE